VRTGSVNQHMPAASQGSPSPAPQPRGHIPAPVTQLRHSSATQNTFETIPSRSSNNFSKKLSKLSKSVDQNSIRSLIISSLAFFLLFLILASTKLYNDHRKYKETETANYQSEVVSKANNTARAIDSEIAWMDTALSLNGSPQQIINFVARGQQTVGAALIDASGTVMASTQPGGKELAKIDRRNFANGDIRISSLISTDGSGVVTPVITKRSGNNYLVVAVKPRRIPNSSLTVIETAPRGLSPDLKNNILLFTLLFAGTAWLVWTLLRNMTQQIQQLRDKKAEDEVSQQRYRAAIDGSRGGVWELDLESNQAYISRSLAGLLGLPSKEQTLSMPQFLGLFATNDREKLISLVRRAHVNGQFDVDVNAAHMPISLACRGRPSVRGSDQAKTSSVSNLATFSRAWLMQPLNITPIIPSRISAGLLMGRDRKSN